MGAVANFTCEKGLGPDLVAWPLLVWSPETGVITGDGHVRIEQIAHMRGANMSIEEIATQLGLTIEAVQQSLAYHAAQGLRTGL